MANKRSAGELTFVCLNALILTGLCFVTLYPFVYVAFASFSDPASLAQHRGCCSLRLTLTSKPIRRCLTIR